MFLLPLLKRLALASSALLMFAFMQVAMADASTITVDTFSDAALGDGTGDGFCDLREAVYATNNPGEVSDVCEVASVDNVIVFDASTDDEELILIDEIEITSDVTILGNGTVVDDGYGTYISGDDLTRLFVIGDGATVTFDNFTIANGYNAENGGGIYVEEGSDLDLVDMLIDTNHADLDGGAIYVTTDSNLNVYGSQFSNNYAEEGHGGAVYIYGGSLDILDSRFDLNSTLDGDGAAVAAYLNLLTVTDTVFTENTSKYGGGAINVQDSTGTLTNNSFEENSSASGTGGAIYMLESVLDFSDNDFVLNDSYGIGGAIASYTNTLTFTRDQFDTNAANGSTAGALYSSASTIVMDDVSIFDNSSSVKGGGIYLTTSDLTINNGSEFYSNVTDEDGGAIYSFRSDLTINDSLFEGHSVTEYGGAIFLQETDSTINGTMFTENNADQKGGAVYVYKGDVKIDDSTFARNTSDYGGAVNVASTDDLDSPNEEYISNSLFTGNSVTNSGGALYIRGADNREFIIENNIFDSNVAVNSAGAVYSWEGRHIYRNNFFTYNESALTGAFVMLSASELEMYHNTFSNNADEREGGSEANAFKSTSPTIMFGNIFTEEDACNVSGVVTSLGYNIENGDTCELIHANDLISTDALLSDVFAPLDESPAMDMIPSDECLLGYDQEGNLRPQNGACDAGALEKVVATPDPDPIVGGVRPNAAPVANADSATTSQNTAVVIDVLSNDTDSDGTVDPSTLAIVDDASEGSAVVADGLVTYTPNADFLGEDSFTYVMRDNENTNSNTATVTVTVEEAVVVLTSDGGGGGGGSEPVVLASFDCEFTDLVEGDDYYEATMYLCENGIVGGYDDGSVGLELLVNRAEELKILVEGLGLTPDEETYADCFPDVAADWYAKYVCYAKEQAWVIGYLAGDSEGMFVPEDTVNIVEAVKMMLEAYEIDAPEVEEDPFLDVPTSEWFARYVAKAKELGILEQTGDYLEPDQDMTRGEIFEILYRLLLTLEV
ncbi:cadherin-like domain-containing protein [Candidatus Peregrinibacteria bacterium]|nr:cadherin-like domain-containing protein [Candidatus Peregrinibacteria bacterium]MBT4631841.1 cadherin-like domain-containing protein [Candidatus Peregrinibacteria bacterium]